MLTFSDLNDMASRLLQLFQDRGAETCYEFMPVAFEREQQLKKPCSSSACVSPSKSNFISAKKHKKNIDVRIPEHLITDDRNQCVTRVIKTSKQQRRKEMRKITKQCAEPEHTAPYFEIRKHKRRQYEKEKYATSWQFRMKKKELAKKCNQDLSVKNKKKEYFVRRYHADAVFQMKMKEYTVRRYHTNAFFQRKIKEHMVRRYKTDDIFRKKMKDYMVRRYQTDAPFQNKMKDYMVRRYQTDAPFQNKMKDYMVRRYQTDAPFQKKMKDYMVRRYETDVPFQNKMKDYMVRRYQTDPSFPEQDKGDTWSGGTKRAPFQKR
ncbi:hypothetical protein QQF64_006634 [Cirrhinus molitorella]|uniref:Uncharacterized protein n=1 Tax=Cirrhinus molitorella TaxID=172907 RepID=A0ABR3MBH3_9TELE